MSGRGTLLRPHLALALAPAPSTPASACRRAPLRAIGRADGRPSQTSRDREAYARGFSSRSENRWTSAAGASYLHREAQWWERPMLDRNAVTDELRARVRAELPEVEEIGDAELRAKVIEAWALALAASSFNAIAEIEPSGNPGVNTLKRGSQTDPIRGVSRMAIALADQLCALLPDLRVDRDLLIAGALCHDVGKPWEFDPENRRRWEGRPHRAGLPSIRHPAFGVHVCLSVGLPEEVAHCAAAHSGEGELLVRSLENTIVHHADYAFWAVCRAGDLLVPETVAELR